jgi:hypothetical protein
MVSPLQAFISDPCLLKPNRTPFNEALLLNNVRYNRLLKSISLLDDEKRKDILNSLSSNIDYDNLLTPEFKQRVINTEAKDHLVISWLMPLFARNINTLIQKLLSDCINPGKKSIQSFRKQATKLPSDTQLVKDQITLLEESVNALTPLRMLLEHYHSLSDKSLSPSKGSQSEPVRRRHHQSLASPTKRQSHGVTSPEPQNKNKKKVSRRLSLIPQKETDANNPLPTATNKTNQRSSLVVQLPQRFMLMQRLSGLFTRSTTKPPHQGNTQLSTKSPINRENRKSLHQEKRKSLRAKKHSESAQSLQHLQRGESSPFLSLATSKSDSSVFEKKPLLPTDDLATTTGYVTFNSHDNANLEQSLESPRSFQQELTLEDMEDQRRLNSPIPFRSPQPEEPQRKSTGDSTSIETFPVCIAAIVTEVAAITYEENKNLADGNPIEQPSSTTSVIALPIPAPSASKTKLSPRIATVSSSTVLITKKRGSRSPGLEKINPPLDSNGDKKQEEDDDTRLMRNLNAALDSVVLTGVTNNPPPISPNPESSVIIIEQQPPESSQPPGQQQESNTSTSSDSHRFTSLREMGSGDTTRSLPSSLEEPQLSPEVAAHNKYVMDTVHTYFAFGGIGLIVGTVVAAILFPQVLTLALLTAFVITGTIFLVGVAIDAYRNKNPNRPVIEDPASSTNSTREQLFTRPRVVVSPRTSAQIHSGLQQRLSQSNVAATEEQSRQSEVAATASAVENAHSSTAPIPIILPSTSKAVSASGSSTPLAEPIQLPVPSPINDGTSVGTPPTHNSRISQSQKPLGFGLNIQSAAVASTKVFTDIPAERPSNVASQRVSK